MTYYYDMINDRERKLYSTVTVRGFRTPWRTHNNILITWFIQEHVATRLLRMWYLLRRANGYDYTVNTPTHWLDTYGGNPPENVVPST